MCVCVCVCVHRLREKDRKRRKISISWSWKDMTLIIKQWQSVKQKEIAIYVKCQYESVNIRRLNIAGSGTFRLYDRSDTRLKTECLWLCILSTEIIWPDVKIFSIYIYFLLYQNKQMVRYIISAYQLLCNSKFFWIFCACATNLFLEQD